jgi:uncharacterized RDD family membrane protein YckC
MDNNISTTSPDLLQELEQEYQYEDASTGLRLANYLIDLVTYYISFITLFTVVVLATQSPAMVTWIDELPPFVDNLIGMVIYAIFMSLIEGFSKGRSLGKLITGTQAVRWDNQPFSWGNAIGRSFSRIVPLEFLSALWGSPWHDTWTNTRVVKMRR